MAFEITSCKKLLRSTDENSGKNPARYVIEAACLSTDTKPTEDWFATGSCCSEVDTRTVFFYDRTNRQWVKQFTFPE